MIFCLLLLPVAVHCISRLSESRRDSMIDSMISFLWADGIARCLRSIAEQIAGTRTAVLC